MTALFENPIPILAIGGLSVAILIGGLIKTGRFAIIYVIAVVILSTVGMVFVERLVITTKEEVEATLHQIATDLKSGDATVIATHIAIDASDLRREASRILPRAAFHEVKVKRNLEISDVDKAGQSLTASFNAVLMVSEKSGAGDKHHVPSFFVVRFVREAARWKVKSYDRRDPRDGIR